MHAPSYLTDLVHVHKPPRNLRSANSNLLNLPFTRSARASTHSFSDYFSEKISQIHVQPAQLFGIASHMNCDVPKVPQILKQCSKHIYSPNTMIICDILLISLFAANLPMNSVTYHLCITFVSIIFLVITIFTHIVFTLQFSFYLFNT